MPVADLLHRPGARRHERRTGTLEALKVVGSSVPAGTDVTVDVELEWVSDGVLATGTAAAHFEAECRRCLTAVQGEATAAFRELFEERPTEGETYPLKGDRIDLEPLARESLLLELPLAPVCREDCLGLCAVCGVDRNQVDCGHGDRAPDPRWAALDRLREELGD
jgi:uncharacterized protein